jgi:uncharacterized protein YajQ (UPF0234 family)
LAEFSFDVTSEVELQTVDNAINTTNKEISNRYDFRGSNAKITREGSVLHIAAEDDYKMRAIADMFRAKATKQGVSLLFFDFNTKIEQALGGAMKQEVPLKQGIDKEKAKDINLFIKDLKLKASSQIQDNKIRVASKSKDELQKVMNALREHDFGIALQFGNYR